MSTPLSEESIRQVYRAVLGREPESRSTIEHFQTSKISLEDFIKQALGSSEFAERHSTLNGKGPAIAEFARHSGFYYNTPQDLRKTQTAPGRVLIVGQCLLDRWPEVLRNAGFKVDVDRLLLTLSPPEQPRRPFSEYSYQISALALRDVLPDNEFFEWLKGNANDEAEAEKLFHLARKRLDFLLGYATVWAAHFPVFVTNFSRPQQSVNGRLLPRYSYLNNVYIVEELNRYLESRLRGMNNCYHLDVDNILSVLGRRSVQDDMVNVSNHGGLFDNTYYNEDLKRISPPAAPIDHFQLNEEEFICTVWLETEAMYRSINQIDSVKMVCVDLDDTLWRGVLSEADDFDPLVAAEGWPLGIAEALIALKRRGILLAVISKNTEERIRELFPKLFRSKITLDDFAVVKINWQSKIENMQQCLQETNLLPRSVVFLDDNPVERASIQAAFPEIRVIESSHYYWKRILLWSAETQGAVITDEASRRTDMIKSQIQRESMRAEMSRDEFVADLGIKARFFRVTGPGDQRYARTFELLNKTNQFNTTGKRWSSSEFAAVCENHTVIAGDVVDRLSNYGLVLVAIVIDGTIEQVVMSCRVISLGVELAAMSVITHSVLQSHGEVTAKSVDTDANLLSKDLFQRCGFFLDGGTWKTRSAFQSPAYIEITRD